MKLVVTIDTEEDDWGRYAHSGHTVHNISLLPGLQRMFDEFEVIPTYLVTYAVATDPHAVSILKSICERGRCEIGMHCHPWNTPPYQEQTTAKNSMICNLPADLQKEKLVCLHEAITESLEVSPVTFRAGRWGYGQHVAEGLYSLGYKVDTSILPFVDWSKEYGPDFSEARSAPYRFHYNDIHAALADGPLLEVPATVGFVGLAGKNFERANRLHRLLRILPYRMSGEVGLLHHLGVVQKIWLSPENSTGREMIALAKTMMRKGAPILNLFFHSPTVQPGLTPFVRNQSDVREFLGRLRMFLRFSADAGIEPVGLSRTAGLF
jgi:hypothetical protein